MSTLDKGDSAVTDPDAAPAAAAPSVRASWWQRIPAWVWSVLAVVALAALIFATRPGNRTEAEDAWRYAAGVRDGGELNLGSGTHPYAPMFLRPVYLALDGIGLSVSADTLMEVTSAIGAATALVLVFFLLRRGLGTRAGVAIAGAAGLGFSQVFWRYSAEMEIYAVGTALAAVAVVYAYLGRPGTRWVVVCGLLTALATVYHLLNAAVLFAAVPFVLWWRAPRDKRVRWIAIQVGIGFVLSVALWAMRPLVAPNAGRATFAPEEAIATVSVEPAHAELAPRNLLEAPIGLAQSIVSGNFLFAHPWFRDAVEGSLGGFQYDEEFYFGERIGPFVAWFPFVTMAGFVALGITVVVRSRKGFRARALDPPVLPLLAWFVAYVPMMVASIPLNPELWTISLVPFWGFTASVFFAPLWDRSRWLPIATVAVLALHNLVGGALPVMAASGDWWQQRTAWLMDQAGPGDVIILSDDAILSGYLQYHSPARVVALPKLTEEEFDEAVSLLETHEGAIWALPGTPFPQKRRSMTEPEYRRLQEFAQTYGGDFRKVHDDPFGGVYRYCPDDSC